MPRPLRIQYAGASYHVMSWGGRREAIFDDETEARWRGVELASQPKGHRIKVKIAQRVRRQTDESQWIADRLRMGSVSCVSNLLASAGSAL